MIRLTLAAAIFFGASFGGEKIITAAAPLPRPKPIVVIDGDTLRIGAERIRIIGLDAPETHQARCRDERLLGDRATERLRELLAAGPVVIARAGREDRYGRTLAVVMVAGMDVAAVLIGEGLARAYDGRGRRQGWCP